MWQCDMNENNHIRIHVTFPQCPCAYHCASNYEKWLYSVDRWRNWWIIWYLGNQFKQNWIEPAKGLQYSETTVQDINVCMQDVFRGQVHCAKERVMFTYCRLRVQAHCNYIFKPYLLCLSVIMGILVAGVQTNSAKWWQFISQVYAKN